MKIPITIAAFLLVGAAAYAATTSPYASVGPWDVTMPDIPQTSCIASRVYPDTIFSMSIAPDAGGEWSLWLTFYSEAYANPAGQYIPAVIRLDETETLVVTGSSDGSGLVYFWTPATQSTLAALETAAWFSVGLKAGTLRYPLDGVDAAMASLQECWTEKQRREGIGL